jgi:hypothetical protein
MHREGPYVRTIVHLLRLRDGTQPARESAQGPGAVVPVQPTNTHITEGDASGHARPCGVSQASTSGPWGMMPDGFTSVCTT